MHPNSSLRLIKILHTIAWAFFAGCILAIPIFAWLEKFTTAALLIGIVFIEVFIILFNKWRCPLTDIAARYTDNREDNFDIYLPLWLARYNKQIFGTLFAAGLIFTWIQWLV
ncbi:hypothetical protein [Rhodohalobacter sulfatireducens]|uniref:DUF2784 domain-containing protein n=1 Tax=Rhodohalobacter sulfatireducens TaxID=2911366 RepID=A0ABS9KDL2_9BACT|nr:hypothetical protein [Rhodohalobacter sulfatireducens]MCG2588939.1 hypothetical protein [Rhodohalobacter sulfatireducens]